MFICWWFFYVTAFGNGDGLVISTHFLILLTDIFIYLVYVWLMFMSKNHLDFSQKYTCKFDVTF